MIKKGWQQLRQQKKNGISMAVVLCVSAFFVAFAAAILYTAGMLTAQSMKVLFHATKIVFLTNSPKFSN